MDKKQAGCPGIEAGEEFVDEALLHGRSHITFDSVLGCREDKNFFVLIQRIGTDPVDSQVFVACDAVI